VRDEDHARERANISYPQDGWRDPSKFEVRLLGVDRNVDPKTVIRYTNCPALPPV
jgi:hypothetical protein